MEQFDSGKKIGTYVMGLNHMSDWSQKEFEMTLGLVPEGEYPEQVIPEEETFEDLPDTKVTIDQIHEKFLNNKVD